MDFLQAIQDVNPGFHTYWIHHTEATNQYPTLYEMVQKFRTYIRQNPEQRGASHGAFTATFQGQGQNTSNSQTETENQRATFSKKCVCGEIHRFRDCPYLIESKRPTGWTPKLDLQRKIDERIQKSKKLRELIERAKKGVNGQHTKSFQDTAVTKPDLDTPAAFTTTILAMTYSSDTALDNYPLQNSFILDSGATVHVCNNRERFQSIRQHNPDQYLYAGT